ncbi:ribbon-helix-helix protein, CopG family [Myxosarcina sp. GI1]|uniref:ribbon-helix-helix protein, CopG family n=1 Tax=Myxosarcina sp. GI1 TaxID=1541065 RepID=UPI001C1148DA|nr:ribbon-helix-helix protein, CopG family [Myxosarcina sp. GI1]
MPKDNRVSPGSWGESKQRTNIMLTPTAIEKVDAVAEAMGLTRSEVIERLIRTPCLDLKVLQEIQGDGDE